MFRDRISLYLISRFVYSRVLPRWLHNSSAFFPRLLLKDFKVVVFSSRDIENQWDTPKATDSVHNIPVQRCIVEFLTWDTSGLITPPLFPAPTHILLLQASICA